MPVLHKIASIQNGESGESKLPHFSDNNTGGSFTEQISLTLSNATTLASPSNACGSLTHHLHCI